MSDDAATDPAPVGPADRVSWAVGPRDSRAIRILFYLAEGSLGGAVLSALFFAADDLLPVSIGFGPWTPGLVAILVLLVLGRAVWFYAIVRVAADRSSGSARWNGSAMAAWSPDQQWRWPLAVVAVVGAVLVAAAPVHAVVVPEYPLWYAALFLAVACSALGELLSSEGRVDPASLTLGIRRRRDRREVDLRTLTAVRRVSVGPFALLWLSVAPGTEERTAKQGFYAMPTAVLDEAWSAFEAGLAADPPVDADAADRGRFFRRVNRAVAGGVLLLGIAGLAALAWVGSSTANVLVLAWLLVAAGLFFLKLAA